MYKLAFIVVAVVVATQSQQPPVVHKYNAAVFDKIEAAGQQAEKIAQEAKTDTTEDKRYVYKQANDYYHYISNAAYVLNKAVFSERVSNPNTQKDLADVTKQLSESACSVLLAINQGHPGSLKDKLRASVEQAKNSVKVLSRLASEVDNIPGGKAVEYDINKASKALQRGFYQIISRHTFLGKTREQIEDHVKTTGARANTEMSEVSGDGKAVARVLKSPAANLVDLVDRVLQRVDEVLYNTENAQYTNTLRDLSYKLLNVYGELVHLKIEFEYVEDGVKLREDLKRLSDKVGANFKELTDLISDATGKEIIEEVLPQTETGVQFLFYYLDLARQKRN